MTTLNCLLSSVHTHKYVVPSKLWCVQYFVWGLLYLSVLAAHLLWSSPTFISRPESRNFQVMTRTALIQMESFALLHVAYTQLVIIWQFEKECVFEIIKALQCGAVPRCSSWPRVQPTVIAGSILHWISPVIKRAPSLPPSGESVLWHSPGPPLSPCEWNYPFKEQCPQAAKRKSPTLGCQSYQKCILTWHPSHSAQWVELERTGRSSLG